MKDFCKGWRSLNLWLVVLSLMGFLQVQAKDLGQIDFPTSGSLEAQKHFLRGVLLLHSFEYDDAGEEFQKAQKLDPDFALAYWGEAMTYNHPIWAGQDREAGRAVLNRLAPTPEKRLAKAPTEREKGYLRVVEILYGEGDKKSRDRVYAEALKRLSKQYPDDLEAASFYALAILGTSNEDRHIPTYMKAAAIGEEVYGRDPEHPGALHYLIHSYDDPVHAPLGLRAARVYAKIAPAAAHALHMPSHIFLALGMWDDVVASNEASWQATETRVKRKGLPVEKRNFHALYWLEYGYLQQGRYREARRMLSIMEEDARRSGSRRTRGQLARMRAAYILETRQWDGDAVGIEVDRSALNLEAAATDLFASGLSAIKTGKRLAAEEELSHMKIQRRLVSEPASAGSTAEIQAAIIMEKELEALILLHRKKAEQAVEVMKEATAAEDSRSFDYGPPIPVKPSHELLGEILLELGQPQEARSEFELALARAPKRVLSLKGLARAAEWLGDQTTAQETAHELRRIWKSADAQLKMLEAIRLDAGDDQEE